jgi:H+/Cl- antiporter ClcA
VVTQCTLESLNLEGTNCLILSLTLIVSPPPKILVASCSSYLTLDLCKGAYLKTNGVMSGGGLINFGNFENPSYTALEFFVFVAIGVFGGLLGALWNALNAKLTQFRMRHLQVWGGLI